MNGATVAVFWACVAVAEGVGQHHFPCSAHCLAPLNQQRNPPEKHGWFPFLPREQGNWMCFAFSVVMGFRKDWKGFLGSPEFSDSLLAELWVQQSALLLAPLSPVWNSTGRGIKLSFLAAASALLPLGIACNFRGLFLEPYPSSDLSRPWPAFQYKLYFVPVLFLFFLWL